MSVVQIACHEQAMPLGADIANGQHQVFGDLPLNSQVVLRRVLRPQIGLQFTEQQDRAGRLTSPPACRALESGFR